MNVMQFKNVVLNDETERSLPKRVAPGNKAEVVVDKLLQAVVKELVVLKPNWKFVGTHCNHIREYEGTTTFSLTHFTIMEDGETLGELGRTYHGSSYKIKVNNHRIAEKRQRGGGYKTEDPKKAIVRIKRTFGRKDTTERLADAAGEALNYVNEAIRNHAYTHRNVHAPVSKAAMDFVMGEGFPLFMQFVHERMPPHESKNIIEATTKADNLKLEMQILEDIRSRLDTKKSALLVRDMGQYIVRVGDNVQLYDDNTLPTEMRGRLGMLKLVDKEHFIENAGCRVSEDVFVVVLDEEASPNNVNQGE